MATTPAMFLTPAFQRTITWLVDRAYKGWPAVPADRCATDAGLRGAP